MPAKPACTGVACGHTHDHGSHCSEMMCANYVHNCPVHG